MTPSTTRARERARLDPAAAYASPAALAADGRLAVRDRLAMLRRWELDVRQRLVASGEGMDGPELATDLGAIARAIATLEGEASGGEPPPDAEHRRAVRYDEIPFPESRGPAGTPPRRVPISVLSIFALLGAFGALVVTAALLHAPLVAAGGLVLLALLIVFARRSRRG